MANKDKDRANNSSSNSNTPLTTIATTINSHMDQNQVIRMDLGVVDMGQVVVGRGLNHCQIWYNPNCSPSLPLSPPPLVTQEILEDAKHHHSHHLSPVAMVVLCCMMLIC
jgi:hypothetical protein